MLRKHIKAACLLVVSLFISLCSIAAFACCSLDFAEFTNTVGFVSELEKDGKRIHLLGYENTAQNGATGGNAMFLPIPAVPGTMSEKNIVDTSNIADFMDKMQATVTEPIVDPFTVFCVLGVICIGLCIRFRTTIIRALKPLILSWLSATAIMILIVVAGSAIGLLWMWLAPKLPEINTVGTVRINNLANLEALLNTSANFAELGGLICGAVFIVIGLSKKNLRVRRIATGVQLIIMGLAFPGMVNWLCASGRDASLFDGPMVFNSGIYTVVLAADASQIPSVLNKVPETKRPKLNHEIFDAYSKWYKGWTIALCCFDNRDAQKSSPMLWWYEPQHPDLLFFPALDAHDGKPPILDTTVQVDHCLVVASDKADGWQDPIRWIQSPWRSFRYDKDSPVVREFIPHRLMGQLYHGPMPQGDFLFRTEDVRRGAFEPQRVLPPGVDGAKSVWSQSRKALVAE